MGGRLDHTLVFIDSMAQRETHLGVGWETHDDIWDMISGADQDFRIISRMMAQIKAVGVLRSRPVYGILYYLLWKKKDQEEGEAK